MERKSNKGKIIAAIGVCAVGLFLFTHQGPKKKTEDKTVTAVKSKTPKTAVKTEEVRDKKDSENKKNRKDRRDSKEPTQTKARSVASVPPQSEEKWRKALHERLLRNLESTGAVPEIKNLGPRKLAKGAASVSAQHVQISINKGGGQVSSYEALVEPKTGRILHTWNRTRFEISKPKTLTVFPLRQ